MTGDGPLIVRAGPDDFAAIQFMLLGASDFLEAKGIRQWRRASMESERNIDWLKDQLGAGTVWIAHMNGEPAGAFVLLLAPGSFDQALWGAAAADPEAAYLHRVVVDRRFAGRQLGRRLLDAAERLAWEAGKRRVRLDCAASNVWLNRYYRRAGYPEIREAVAGEWTCRLHEKVLGPTQALP